jgi:SWI/SNF related-matrix-associated actin-dependent regulator of chromatin subfamily C
LADPASTAAAAHKSADELKQKLRKRLEAGPGEKAKQQADGQSDGDSMDVDGRQEATAMATTTTIMTTTTTTTTTAQAVASLPLASMGARAAGLASNEEREMARLVSAATNVTLQKLDLKLRYFTEMEAALQAERRELEKARQQLFLDRLQFKRRVAQVHEGIRSAAAIGGEQGLSMAQEVMSEGIRLGLQPTSSVLDTAVPLSKEGIIKTYEA